MHMRFLKSFLCFLTNCFEGFLIYFGYGLWHSEERQRLLQGTPDGDRANGHNLGIQEGEFGKEQESFVCQEKL